MKCVCVVLFTLCLCATSLKGTEPQSNDAGKSKWSDVMDVSDFSIYYDVQTNQTIKKMLPRPWYKPGWLLRLPFSGGPCNCEGLKCECCTGIRIPAVNFDRQTCTILNFEPEESFINMEVMMNNQSIYKNTFSARNPIPICIPVPVPYLPPGLVDMCLRIFDVNLMDQMLHMCLDVDTRVDRAPVLILHFDCMNMGLNGVSLTKPGGPGNQTNTSPQGSDGTTAEPEQVNADIYDPVSEDTPTTKIFENSIRYI